MQGVFLDRDGTLIEEVGYLDRVERVALYPWTIDAVRALNRARFRVVMISNQSVVAKGFCTEVDAGGAQIDAYYYCPHHPDGKVDRYAIRCDCRKPARGLVYRAVHELGIDPARSFVVGDRWLDVELAHTVGARGVLVRTGYGLTEETRPPHGVAADAVVDNLIAAAGWILRERC